MSRAAGTPYRVKDKAEALKLAQELADLRRRTYEVYEHVGHYGRPGGDIEATHEYRVVPGDRDTGRLTWALVAVIEPTLSVTVPAPGRQEGR